MELLLQCIIKVIQMIITTNNNNNNNNDSNYTVMKTLLLLLLLLLLLFFFFIIYIPLNKSPLPPCSTQWRDSCRPAPVMTMRGCGTTFTQSWRCGGWPWLIRRMQTWMRTEPKLTSWSRCVGVGVDCLFFIYLFILFYFIYLFFLSIHFIEFFILYLFIYSFIYLFIYLFYQDIL